MTDDLSDSFQAGWPASRVTLCLNNCLADKLTVFADAPPQPLAVWTSVHESILPYISCVILFLSLIFSRFIIYFPLSTCIPKPLINSFPTFGVLFLFQLVDLHICFPWCVDTLLVSVLLLKQILCYFFKLYSLFSHNIRFSAHGTTFVLQEMKEKKYSEKKNSKDLKIK